MLFYKKQGVPCEYFPLIGYYKNMIPGAKEHEDTQYHTKQSARKGIKRALCSNLGSNACLFLYDPALIKEFFLNNDNYIKDPLFLELFAPILGKGLLTSEGSQWKAQRKALSCAFHFDFIKSILPSIQATAHKNLYNLRKISLNKVHAMDELQKITGEVVGKVFFGEELNEYEFDGRPLTLALADLTLMIAKASEEPLRFILGGWFVTSGILPRHRKLMQKIKQFREICHQIVQNRKKLYSEQKGSSSISKKDLLQTLIEYSGSEGKMDDEEIVDQFVALFLAGMDTTGHLLTMVVYYLYKYPEYKNRMTEEIQMYYKPNGVVTQESLNKLEFTMAFLKETLRIATPVIGVFPRKALKDHYLGDLHIRKGDIVLLDYMYNHYNPTYFDNVDDFKPERWLDKAKIIDSYAFTPFSAGARNCIGQHLALNEAKIILGELLTMYDFKLQDGYQLKMASPFLYEPLDPVLLDLTPKN